MRLVVKLRTYTKHTTNGYPFPSKYAFILLSSSPSMPPRHGLSLQQMPSPWRHSIWNANAESWESCGGSSFATRKYLRSLVYLPSTTSSDIVASPSLDTSPDRRTAPQHIKPYSLTSTSHSVVYPIPPGVVGLVAHVAAGSTKSETTPARHLPTSGDRLLDAVIVDERCDGPRWLCDDDDDDNELATMPKQQRNTVLWRALYKQAIHCCYTLSYAGIYVSYL